MSQTRTRLADDPAQAGLFDLDDPDIVGNTAERRLAARVAAKVPKDAVLRPVDGGDPTVLIAVVAQGTYGQVTGLDPDRKPTTAQGYVVHARTLRGGIGGWHPDAVMVVKLADLPDGPAVATVQTDMDGRLTVLAPPGGMPPGESAPWLRMPVEVQILAARTLLGLRVRVFDGPHNELWDVEGCPEQLTSEVAAWLFGGDSGSWEARARPVFGQRRVDEAVRAGRGALGDSIATAQTRATRLIPAANSLADRIHTTPEAHVAELSSIGTAESVADDAPASSGARVAFPRPPHAQSDPAGQLGPTSAVQTPQPSATQGNRR